MTGRPAQQADAGELWRQQLATAFDKLSAERLDDLDRQDAPALTSTVRSATLGRANAYEVAGSPQIVRRTKASVGCASSDPLKICIQRGGRAIVHQAAQELVVEPGCMAIYDTGRPYGLRLEGDWCSVVLTVPRDALGLSPRALSEAMVHQWEVHDGPGAVLAHLVSSVLRTDPAGYDEEHLGEASVQLLASLLNGGRRTGPAPRTDEDVRQQIIAYVRTHLRDVDLGHATVAHSHRMSERTLTRLFESQPETVTQLIRRLRLEAIRSELLSPAQRRRATMAIAAGWGYADPAHFTRAFKAQFGVTPGVIRRGG